MKNSISFLFSLCALLTLPFLAYAQGGNTIVDVSVCNTPEMVAQYNATMPDGTIKLGVSPRFVITGSSLCGAQYSARLISTTTAYVYDVVTRTYKIASTRGYPITETSKDVVIKPGAFSITNKLASKPADQVLQMRTEVKMYMSSSFDANGKLFPDAVELGAATASWTQTNFVTQ